MDLTLTFLAGLSLGVWLYLFFARGNFWRLSEDLSTPKWFEHWPRIVAIVPARNEAETIAASLVSLLKQDYPGEFSIVVVDDESEDATAELARQTAGECGSARRVTVVRAGERPAGWTGKFWAQQEGIRAATAEPPEFFWFTDADIVHAHDTLRRLMIRAEEEHLGLASLFVLLHAKTFAERMLIPPFLYFFLLLYPPRWIADPKKKTAGAAGGCILIRRSALERIGGLDAIRGEVIDDCALARAVKKRSGEKIWMGLTRSSASLRSYKTFPEIREMIARTAFTQLGYSPMQLIGAVAALFATYWLAWIVFFVGNGAAWLLSDVAISLMLTTFVMSVRYYRLSPVWTLSLPIAVFFYGYATCVSAVRYWLGRGGQWKGRVQAPRAR